MKKILSLLLLAVALAPAAISAQSKSVSILGDSYSTFRGYLEPDSNFVWYSATPNRTNDVTDVRQTWWHRLLSDTGMKLCVNNSFSGSTVCNTGYHGNDYTDRSFIARMDNLGCPDIIYVFGGTNDSWAGVPVGEFKYDGWTKEDLYKFRPAAAYMLDYMTKRYPNVEIVWLVNSGLLAEVTESIAEICRHYGVDFIRLQSIDCLEGHPSIKGMGQIADQIKAHRK